MSRAFNLVCHETKSYVNVGQGRRVDGKIDMQVFYHGDEALMTLLKQFLNDTAGKPIVLMDEESIDIDYKDYEP